VEAICRRFRDNWVQGAVLTGGEPTLHSDLPAVVEKLRDFGFAVKLDTNGSRPRVLEKLLPLVDYVAMDIKCAPEEYGARTGFADVAALTESIRLIREHAADYEFRTTVIESWHTPETMTAIGEWVGGTKRHVLQAFVPREHLPDPAMRVLRETPADVLRALADILRRHVQCVEIRGGF
jgi:pyruvate formate lyase activating enzyme